MKIWYKIENIINKVNNIKLESIEGVLLIILFVLTIITIIGDYFFNWNKEIGIFTFDIPFILIWAFILFRRPKDEM